jgi:hypothetical protein
MFEISRRNAERVFAILLLVLPEAFHVEVMPWGVVCAIGAWLCFTDSIVWPSLEGWKFCTGQKVVISLLLAIALGEFIVPAMNHKWREEKAAALEGDLVGAGAEINSGPMPMVQIADVNIFAMAPQTPGVPPPPYFQPFQDAEFRVEFGKKGPLVSTTIRDAEGHIIAVINKNHWKVFPEFCPDKNYTDDGSALEITDNSWHVIFQLRILLDRVRVQAEWWNNQGQGIRILKAPDLPPHGIIAPLGPTEKKNGLLIKPMFVHPSKDHWEELAN